MSLQIQNVIIHPGKRYYLSIELLQRQKAFYQRVYKTIKLIVLLLIFFKVYTWSASFLTNSFDLSEYLGRSMVEEQPPVEKPNVKFSDIIVSSVDDPRE